MCCAIRPYPSVPHVSRRYKNILHIIIALNEYTEAMDTATFTGRAMANGWDTGGAGTVADPGTHASGPTAAQARGVKMGRKPLLSALQVAHARTLLEQGEWPVHVAQLLKMSRRTLERALSSAGVGHLLHTSAGAPYQGHRDWETMGRAHD